MDDIRRRLEEALAGRYRLERELGRGGMGVVFLAADLKHGRKVALKVLRPELTQSIGADRFLREIRITAQLNHPNILTLIDSGTAAAAACCSCPAATRSTSWIGKRERCGRSSACRAT